jgi:DNA-binding LacI/PurR family transcriptional regulator
MIFPEKISVVVFGRYEFARIITPSLTIINVNLYDLGKKAMEMILQWIEGRNMRGKKSLSLMKLKSGNRFECPKLSG